MQKVRKGEELNEQPLKVFLKDQQLISDTKVDWEVSQFSGHDMGREFKVLTGLNKRFEKAPKAYAYTEDKAILGVPFYVMEKVEGIIIDLAEAKKRMISKTEFPIIANSWLDTLVELHALDYEAVGLGDLGRPNGYVERQVRNWSKQYLKAATEEIPEAQKVMDIGKCVHLVTH